MCLQVQDTNDSSTLSKVSSSVKGYFVDPFIEKICPVQSCRSPLINRYDINYIIVSAWCDKVLFMYLFE